ncbi:VUT family protein [Citrobacter koseri]|uniref:VUT family protein n=1 Tax=Citrobacter koseri TaxID=545 RepID=UPI00389A59C3
MLFTIILCCTTLFFFDHKELAYGEHAIHFSVGLIVFPLTFTISNVLQDRYGKLYANTVTRYAFICDLVLVSIAYILCNIGDRNDYFSVYKQPPVIMGVTFLLYG